MITDAPVQTNAADPEQVDYAGGRQTEAERQAIADDRALLADEAARRRSFADLAPLFVVVGGGWSDADLREWVGERRIALRKMQRWMRHRELFTQMFNEGLKRMADEDKAARARHVKSRT